MSSRKPSLERESWMEIYCSDHELLQWLKAAGIDSIETWVNSPQGSFIDRQFQTWCRNALDAAAKRRSKS